MPAQNEVKARAGEAPAVGLQAQKKKVGFLERLAGVAKGRKEEQEVAPAEKREPDFGQPKAVPMPVRQTAGGPPKGLRIERPGGDGTANVVAKRIEGHGRPQGADVLEQAHESAVEDDLEIPAFLRRRAT